MTTTHSATDYLPWDWSIQATDPNKTCPSTSHILGTFAWVNVLVSVAGALVGHKAVTFFVMSTLFCRRAPKKAEVDLPLLDSSERRHKSAFEVEKTSRHYFWTWIFPFGLGLAANALNAYIMRKAQGYHSTYTILEMTLFMAVRPRLGVVFICFLENLANDDGDDENNAYHNAAISSMFAEMAMQAIAVYTTGQTVYLASKEQYYAPKNGPKFSALPLGAKMLYAGALGHVISFANTGVVFIVFVAALASRKDGYKYRLRRLYFLSSLMYPYITCWIFLAGYVKIAGPLYCLPSLNAQGGIWSTFSVIGTLISGS